MDIGSVDKCSGAYGSGKTSGVVFTAVAGGAGAARTLGYEVVIYRYKNAGGVGINLLKNKVRKFGIDYHRFKYKGVSKYRLHYHRGKTKSQMKKHRPYQGGW